MKTYKLMVWNGEDFHEDQSSDDFDQIEREFNKHKRVMPNCPCLIEVSYVVDAYDPE